MLKGGRRNIPGYNTVVTYRKYGESLVLMFARRAYVSKPCLPILQWSLFCDEFFYCPSEYVPVFSFQTSLCLSCNGANVRILVVVDCLCLRSFLFVSIEIGKAEIRTLQKIQPFTP